MTYPGTTVSPRSFYGAPKLRDVLKANRLMSPESIGLLVPEDKYVVWKTSLPLKHRSLVGPSQTWRVFKKQQVALEFARVKTSELMTFVYQESSEDRVFLVAHPTVFWYFDVKQQPSDRCSYEIIPELSVCKLYFDLEFDKEFNPYIDGVKITETFIKIVNYYLEREWAICVNRSHILDLDSTSEIKFSRHLIYQLPNAAFCDNFNVGRFVKMICSHLRDFIFKLPISSTTTPNILEDLCTLNLLDRAAIYELLIFDNKGNQKLFCDEAVYTKNRHFRLFGSTKRKKNSPLVESQQNLYKSLPSEQNLNLFLDSLITYFPSALSDLRLLEYGVPTHQPSLTHTAGQTIINSMASNTGNSPHPEVDRFISCIVAPGHINRWFYFSSSNRLVYCIIGFRFCNNIGRQHRSNGIKFVVNLVDGVYYQKCFDPDCAGYRSNELKLPADIASLYNSGASLIAESGTLQPSYFGIQDEGLSQVLNAVECAHLEDINKPETKSSSIDLSEPCTKSKTGVNSQPAVSHFTNEELIEVMSAIEDSESLFSSNEPLSPLSKSTTSVDCGRLHFTNEELIHALDAVEKSQNNAKVGRPLEVSLQQNQSKFSDPELMEACDTEENPQNVEPSRQLFVMEHHSKFTNEELMKVLDAVEKSQNNNEETGSRPSRYFVQQQQWQFTNEELIGVLDTVERSQKSNANKIDVPKTENVFPKHDRSQFTDEELIEAVQMIECSKDMSVKSSQSSLDNNFNTDELMQMMDCVEESGENQVVANTSRPSSHFPDFGISDSQLLTLDY